MYKISSNDFLKLFSLPIILYVFFIFTRLKGFQPSMEGEMGDFITALNFLFGSFVAYFVYIILILDKQTISKYRTLWWWLMCMLLALLAFDELFMIHEFIGDHYGIQDMFVFLFYGILLGVLLLFSLEETFNKNTFFFLIIFTVFSIISQVSDYLYNEGTILILGREISYEQFAESFGALSLSCAIATIAIRQIVQKEPQTNRASYSTAKK